MTDTLTSLLLERLAPWLTPQTDPTGDHATFLRAICAPGEQLFSLVWDQGDPDDADYQPGWGVLFDVDAVPLQFLPFLAQLVGVPAAALAGLGDADARSVVRQEQGQQRGTLAAVIAAAKRFLSATQSTAILERVAADGSADAYHFLVVVRPEEIVDERALVDAVNAVKPGGLQWDLIQTDTPLLIQYTRSLAAVTATLAAATLADVT